MEGINIMAENKVLLAISKSMPTQGNRGEWSELKQASDYIVGIDSGAYDESAIYSSDELAKDVTGFPSAWARSNFIKLALSRFNMSPQGLLDGIYGNLREEWRGLVTLIATEASKISVDVIPLASEEESGFSLAQLLGDVLFLDGEDKNSLWYDKDVAEGKVPFIQLIKYNGKVIGASSPDTLVFPAVKYDCEDVKWFDRDKRRFVTPQLNELTERQLKDLYLVLSKIEKGIESEDLKEAREVLREFVRDWISQVEKEAKKCGYEISKTGVLGSKLPFVGKLGMVLACDDKIYEYEDRYYFEPRPGAVAVDLASYLLPNNSTVCELRFGANSLKKLPKDLGVYVLMPADDGNGRHFFPLPLTEEGLLKWCNTDEKVQNLLKPFERDDKDAASRPHIEAVLVGDSLHVTLSILIQNDVKEFKRQYQVKKDNKKFNERSCVLWPNFVSPIWRDYYLYTECLEDVVSGVVTKPIYFYYPNEDQEGTSFIVAENEDKTKSQLVVGLPDDGFTVNLKSESRWTQDKKFEAKKIVKDRGNSSAKHHYDVWRSNKPIAGVVLTLRDSVSAEEMHCGYLLFRKLKTIKKFDITDEARQVTMGMDFGSNNSCVYFKKKQGSANAEPLEFRNMRVFAFGEDEGSKHDGNAKLDEILFFQNEPKDGQFKSWVVLTDKSLDVPAVQKNQTVSGGMNIFEPNLNVLSIDTNRGVMDIENVGDLYYNMKWRSAKNDEFGETRRVFVDSIWRQAVANLFLQQEMVPVEFRWSYPGAFTQKLITGLHVLYDEVIHDFPCPFCKENTNFEIRVPRGKEAMTEAASVLSSIGTSVSVDTKNIVVAMDIGGSTTDLLVWYLDKDREEKVIQSSVCMAAGSVTSLFEHSDELRKAMIAFQSTHPEEVPIATVGDFQTKKDLSYYYVNTIFDIVAEHSGESWTKGLYEEFAKGANKATEAFALPAYIAGFLTFYAGMLLHHILKENNITTLDKVTIHPVGKGSRILDWLKTRALGGAECCEEYLQDCLRAGLRNEAYDKVELEFKFERDPKSVVAKGLVMQKNSNETKADQIILFGEQGLVNRENDTEVDMELNLEEKFKEAYNSRLRLESNADKPFPVFKSFCDVYLKYVKENELVEPTIISTLRKAIEDMRPNTLNAWISHQPTFEGAQEDGDKDFEYKESYLVLESLYFLEQHLVPIVTK